MQAYKSNNFQAASEIFKTVVAAEPANPDNHAYLANVLYRLGDLTGSEKIFKLIILCYFEI